MKKSLLFLCFAFILSAEPLLNLENIYGKPPKNFMIEALYGFGEMNHPMQGYIHEAKIHGMILTPTYTHELLGRFGFSQNNLKAHKTIPAKYNSYEVEYRFGMRMDNEMSQLGMIFGTVYIGLGYNNVGMRVSSNPKETLHSVYIPIGFWGEDSMMGDFKLRYGINAKLSFLDNVDKNGDVIKGMKFFGGKAYVCGRVYMGIAYSIEQTVDIFAQAYFSYNAPIKNLRQYGIEVGLKY